MRCFNIYIIGILLRIVSMTLSGCILELFGLEGAELGELAMTAEEEGLAAEGGFNVNALRAGRVLVESEASANSILGEMRLVKVPRGNPRIFVKGDPEPFGDVLPEEREIRLRNGTLQSINNTIFSVESNEINVRSSPSALTKGNIVSTLKKGSLVINLGEVGDGWYKIEIIESQNVKYGYVRGASIAPLTSDSISGLLTLSMN
jgi:hypothetical protein